MKRLLTLSLLALLLIPAAAGAMPRLDGAIPRSQANQFTRSAPAQPAPAPTASVVRTVTTKSGNSTLSVVLASTALGVALTGFAYVALRVRPLPRSS